MQKIFAHSNPDFPFDKSHWETLEAHLRKTADFAGKFAVDFNCSDLAKTLAFFHDIGKASEDFQNRLCGNGKLVDHSTAGAKKIVEKLKYGIGYLLAYAIAGHHGGMPDGIRLEERLNEKNISEWEHNFDLSYLFVPEIRQSIAPFVENGFSCSFWVRMMFSCLVDADFLATESFMSCSRADVRNNIVVPKIKILEEKLVRYLKRFENPERELGKIRNEILNDCLDASKNKPGIFTLTVPTGGGKTLSSLAFALKHANEHGLKRVIYAIPFTSIIEQTAKVFREAIGDDAVLEHHCNFEAKDNDLEYSPSELLSENWDASVIVTTNVQLFESLFSNKPSQCRKLHNLAKSVIVLDEAQMLPLDYLRPCLRALKELVKNYGATVVVCTATQPALSSEKLKDEILAGMEIIKPNRNLHDRLRRVKVEKISEGKIGVMMLAERLSKERQVLAIVNTKSQARETFEALKNCVPVKDCENIFHLSTNLCAEHRTKILEKIRKCLYGNEPCRVISTQLIEAGVDIDFPCVYRAFAGIDSIAQAAGRCNREGKIQGAGGRVFVFEPEKLPPAGFLRKSAECGKSIFAIEKYSLDLLAPESVNAYFENMYWSLGGTQALDKLRVLGEVFPRERPRGRDDFFLFNFKECGENFHLIDDAGTHSVIVPFDEYAKELCEQLRVEFVPVERRKILQKLQRYSVSVYENDFNKFCEDGVVQLVHNCIPVLVSPEMYYDESIGLKFSIDNTKFLNF